MRKKVLIVSVCLAILIVCLFVSVLIGGNLKFEGSSTITIGENTTTTYTPGKFLSEMNGKILFVYEIDKAINLTADPGSVSKEKITELSGKLEEVNSFNQDVNNLQGEGAQEFQEAINTWYIEYKRFVVDNAIYIADRVNEQGEPNNPDEIPNINERIMEMNEKGMQLSNSINSASDKFIKANNL